MHTFFCRRILTSAAAHPQNTAAYTAERAVGRFPNAAGNRITDTTHAINQQILSRIGAAVDRHNAHLGGSLVTNGGRTGNIRLEPFTIKKFSLVECIKPFSRDAGHYQLLEWLGTAIQPVDVDIAVRAGSPAS